MLKTLKSVVKSSFIYGLGNISSKLVGFILLPLYTKHLTVADYGILSIIEITIQLLVSIIGLKLYTALLRWYWEKEYISKQKSIFFTSFLSVILITLLFVLFGIPFSGQLAKELLDDTKYSYLILLMLISTGLQVNIQMVQSLMRIQERPGLFSISSLLKLLTTLLCTIYFVVNLERGVDGIYEAQIIGQTIFFLFTAIYILKNISLKIEVSILKDMLAFCFPLLLAEIAGVVFSITSRYSLKFLATMEDVGLFSLGFKVANTVKVLVVTSILLAITPIIYKKIDDPDNKRFYSKIMTYFCLGITFLVTSLSMFSKEIIMILAKNQDYWNSYTLVPILSFSILFATLKDVSLTGLHITKKTKVIAGIMALMSILNVFLNILLINYFGSIGAAFATLIAQIIFFYIIYKKAQEFYPIPYEIKKLFKIIFTGIVLFILSILTQDFAFFYKISTKLLLLIIFPIILYLWNFYEEIELIRLKQSWNKWKKIKNWRKISFK